MNSSDDSSDEADYEINFSPKYFLRCHSKHRKDAADVQTNVSNCLTFKFFLKVIVLDFFFF